MTRGYLTTASRRRLLAGVALLGTGPRSATAGFGAVADMAHGAPTRSDWPLLAAAAAFCAVEQRKLSLIEGPDRVINDAARDRLLEPLCDEQLVHLDVLCRQRAVAPATHRARAIAFALWDGGELSRLH